MAERSIIKVSGEDRLSFLQGLVTNDVEKCRGGLVYAALLTPQGKYLSDFFLLEAGGCVLLDVHASLAPGLAQRLMMYKLRSRVEIGEAGLQVSRGLGPGPSGSYSDPRHPDLGWRLYSRDPLEEDSVDWDSIRVRRCVPESGVELVPNETYILEAGFERLSGVDFHKGCYVGQEVTARMKHKTSLRKGYASVTTSGKAEAGAEVTCASKPVGRLFTASGNGAIAYLRFDRLSGPLMAGACEITEVRKGI